MMIMTIDSSLNGKYSCYTVILILVMAVTDDSENTFDIPNLLWLKTWWIIKDKSLKNVGNVRVFFYWNTNADSVW